MDRQLEFEFLLKELESHVAKSSEVRNRVDQISQAFLSTTTAIVAAILAIFAVSSVAPFAGLILAAAGLLAIWFLGSVTFYRMCSLRTVGNWYNLHELLIRRSLRALGIHYDIPLNMRTTPTVTGSSHPFDLFARPFAIACSADLVGFVLVAGLSLVNVNSVTLTLPATDAQVIGVAIALASGAASMTVFEKRLKDVKSEIKIAGTRSEATWELLCPKPAADPKNVKK